MTGRVEFATHSGARDTRALVDQGRAWIQEHGPGSPDAIRRGLAEQDAALERALRGTVFDRDAILGELRRQDADLHLAEHRRSETARRVAWHEAGHAAVAWALGVRLGPVWLFHDAEGRSTDGTLGTCRVSETHPVVTAAGVAAEELVGPVHDETVRSHDARIFRAHHAAEGEKLDRETFVGIHLEAEQRVERMRPAIEALAARLLERGHVSGAEAESIISESTRAA